MSAEQSKGTPIHAEPAALGFLSVDAAGGPDAPSPVERQTLARGARREARDGWSVAVDYGSPREEADRCAAAMGWADFSQLGKLELQAGEAELGRIVSAEIDQPPPAPGLAARVDGGWWCRVAPERMLVICDPGRLAALRDRLGGLAKSGGPASVIDLTTAHAALVIAGPRAREAIARFCALDLRLEATPVGALRPGSVARTPGYVLREGPDRFLLLFGWALAEYMWTVVADAAEHLGGAPVGADALAERAESERRREPQAGAEVRSHA